MNTLQIQCSPLNAIDDISELSEGQLIIIQRKRCKRKLLVQVKEILHGEEILLSRKRNDYFIWDMYRKGSSWVWRVWALPSDIEMTNITNNMNEFPR